MNLGINIEFFEEEKHDKLMFGVLYLNLNGKNYIDFKGTFADVFRVIKVIYAKAVSRSQLYTLVNCTFKYSDGETYRFYVNEIYEGAHLGKVTDLDCSEAESTFTGLTNWINKTRIKPEIVFSSNEESKVVIKEQFQREFKISDTLTLMICEFCTERYERNITELRNSSYVRFISSTITSRHELFKNISAFLKFLSLFTNDVPKLTSLNYTLIDKTVVKSLSDLAEVNDNESDSSITYDKLEPLWPEIIFRFFSERDKFCKVIDLLIESITNTTAEISFLNLTTALEVMHKYFYEDIKNDEIDILNSELFDKVVQSRRSAKWTQIMRYAHLFKEAYVFDSIKNLFSDRFSVVEKLKDSRNYYTHYSETNKHVWTPNQLFYINTVLRRLISGLILRKLLLPEQVINRSISSQSAFFYNDYEKNKFSVKYVDSSSLIIDGGFNVL